MEEKIAILEANVTLLNEGNTQTHEIIQSLTTSLMQTNTDMTDLTTKMRSLEQWMLKYEHNFKVMKDKIGTHEHENNMMKQQIDFLKDALEETKKRKREDDADGETVARRVVPDALPESAE